MSARQEVRVLLVEDNPADVLLAKEALAGAGPLDLAVAERLDKGVERLRESPFDVVLLDLGLPDSQGLDTLLKLRRSSPEVPVVVMTGRDDEGLALRAVQEGAQDYLVKSKSQLWEEALRRSIRYAVERRRGEAELRKKDEQLRQAQKLEAIGRLAGGIAHDFNNLLTIINGYSEIIQGQLPPDSPVWILAREIAQAGERAAGLTRQLLAFSRKQVLEPKVLNLNAVVADTAKMLGRLLGEDIELATALEPALGRVKADPGQIEQVLINLSVNARDAMPQGGKLTVETANFELDEPYTQPLPDLRPGPYVMMAVSDTGHGMDEGTKARIFEPFFTTKGEGKGTGLGLATVFGIIKQSEGHVAVDSEPGRGATFKVYLPRVEEVAPASTPHCEVRSAPHGEETILLVEDEPALLALSRHVLQGRGYTVLEATDGERAVRLAEQYPGTIHLIVTDVIMPGMSGRRVAERVTALRPHVRVLFLSGYTDDAVVRHGILQAEAAFLQKPFSPSALAGKIRWTLDHDNH